MIEEVVAQDSNDAGQRRQKHIHKVALQCMHDNFLPTVEILNVYQIDRRNQAMKSDCSTMGIILKARQEGPAPF